MERTPAQPVTAPVAAKPPPPLWKKLIFLAALVACALPWSSPPIALAAGIVVALLGIVAFEKQGKLVSRYLIQGCVVLLGFRLDLTQLGDSALLAVILASGTVLAGLAAGWLLGRALGTQREVSGLLCSGTAVCGGSAIAAVGSALKAAPGSMAVATGCVFLLNAAALYVLPLVGQWLQLSPTQFGAWVGMSVHDVSSVVGAATSYGDSAAQSVALDQANVVKLSRVLWIIPLTLFAAWIAARGGGIERKPGWWKSAVPWFVFLFIAASAARSTLPAIAPWSDEIKFIARTGFQAALFLIGAGLSVAALKQVGWRAFAQAAGLWVLLAVASLLVVSSVLP